MFEDPSQIRLPVELPEEVAVWLRDVASRLAHAFGPELVALVLFGSAADGRMRASSDVNLLIVLHEFDGTRALEARDVLEGAAAAIALHPMFVLLRELQLAAESFSLKFDDILHRRFIIFGEDPFKAVSIPRHLLLHRVRQVLLNVTLRLRSTAVLAAGREERLVVAIADAAAPLRRSAQTLLELRGAAPASPKAALETLASELGGPFPDLIPKLSQARETLRLPSGTAGPLVLQLAALAAALQQLAGDGFE